MFALGGRFVGETPAVEAASRRRIGWPPGTAALLVVLGVWKAAGVAAEGPIGQQEGQDGQESQRGEQRADDEGGGAIDEMDGVRASRDIDGLEHLVGGMNGRAGAIYVGLPAGVVAFIDD